MRIASLCLVSALFLSSGALAQPAPSGPFKGSRGIGTWEATNTGKMSPFEDKKATTTWIFTTREVVDGWYLETRCKEGDRTISVSMTTSDAGLKNFKNWGFAGGNVVTMTGQWDEKSRTLTLTGTDQFGNRAESVQKWLDDDSHEDSFVLKSQAGATLIDFTSKVKRVKEAAK